MTECAGTFELEVYWSQPDQMLDHVFGGPHRSRYEHVQGRDGSIDVSIRVQPGTDMADLTRRVAKALKDLNLHGPDAL